MLTTNKQTLTVALLLIHAKSVSDVREVVDGDSYRHVCSALRQSRAALLAALLVALLVAYSIMTNVFQLSQP